jgi:hypothetical protein
MMSNSRPLLRQCLYWWSMSELGDADSGALSSSTHRVTTLAPLYRLRHSNNLSRPILSPGCLLHLFMSLYHIHITHPSSQPRSLARINRMATAKNDALQPHSLHHVKHTPTKCGTASSPPKLRLRMTSHTFLWGPLMHAQLRCSTVG